MEQPPKKEPRSTTDQRQTQMADAFRNFQQCVQYCQKAVFFTDAAGILQRVNPAFERLTGYPSIESVGKDLSWITADGPASESYRKIWHEIYENSAFRGALEVRRRDGNCLQMELTAIPVRDRDGQINTLVCTGRDMREEHGVEVKLSEARKLNAIATLARAVAHDLNNTLMIVSSYSELALEGLSHDNPLWRRLHEIKGAAQRACELAGEMLAFGQNGPQGRELVSLNSLVQQTCRILPRVTGADMQLQVALGEENGLVDANTSQMQQLLLNLAVSARDAMPDGGRLMIGTSTVDIDAFNGARKDTPAGKCALLSVSVVKPARAAERAPSSAIKAGALANQRWIREPELAAVEDLARENHGFVAVEHAGNDTVAVNVYFPIAQGAESSVFEAGLKISETVLLVEDESVIRTAAVEFLSSTGYNVLSATNGQEAFEQILSHPGKIDLVITDVIMPQMSGPKLAEAAAAIRPDTKVLFVSGSRDALGTKQASVETVDNFLLKPFSLRTLGSKIREVLAQPAPNRRTRAAGVGAN